MMISSLNLGISVHLKESKQEKQSRLKKAIGQCMSRLVLIGCWKLLPIDVVIKKGFITLGGQSTQYLLVTGFKTCDGTFGAVQAKSKHDKYKSVFQFTFGGVKSVFRTNMDHDGEVTDYGQRVKDALEREQYVLFHY